MTTPAPAPNPTAGPSTDPNHHLRFHLPHAHLGAAFGNDAFGVKMVLLQQNTELTRVTQELSQRIEALTAEMHGRVMRSGA